MGCGNLLHGLDGPRRTRPMLSRRRSERRWAGYRQLSTAVLTSGALHTQGQFHEGMSQGFGLISTVLSQAGSTGQPTRHGLPPIEEMLAWKPMPTAPRRRISQLRRAFWVTALEVRQSSAKKPPA